MKTIIHVKEWLANHFSMVSLATVYNTLHSLVDADSLCEVKLPHTSKVVYNNKVTMHHHFPDEDRGQLFDVDLDMIELSPNFRRECLTKDVHVLLGGRRRPG